MLRFAGLICGLVTLGSLTAVYSESKLELHLINVELEVFVCILSLFARNNKIAGTDLSNVRLSCDITTA